MVISYSFDDDGTSFSVPVKRRPVDPIVFYLATALGICVTVICGLAIQICSDSVQAVRNSEASVISAEPGQAVTLNCMFASQSGVDVKMWYKQRLEHAPLEVGTQLEGKSGMISNKFDRSRYKISRTASGVSLRIERVTKEDEGMYFCGAAGTKTLDFSNSTFLAVTGQLDISVLQTPVQGSVSPGESVTLQCTVLSEIRAADLRVLWFRAAAGQSFPEIIYTHQNSSSRQCEISSSTHSSVYSFSRNILNHHHTGTYYCAVAACEKIIFGNGTAVCLNKAPVDPVTMSLAVFSAVCVAVICAQTIFIYKMRRSEHRAGEGVQERGVNERTTRQSCCQDNPFLRSFITHQNSSSRQCEISSSTHSSVYNFSRNILQPPPYWNLLLRCGLLVGGHCWGMDWLWDRIRTGFRLSSGGAVKMDDSVSHPSVLLVVTGLALGLCAVWSIALCCCCMKGKLCECCGGNKPHPDTHDLSRADELQDQGHEAMELNYAALHFSERSNKRGKKKKKRGRPQDSVYSESPPTSCLHLLGAVIFAFGCRVYAAHACKLFADGDGEYVVLVNHASKAELN
ncbi:hypothetical protein NFI96_028887 [Prochilodus magdalenae]|nr:hypothetical protein NFI96_028887 [Prochilodus magdalenae]